MCGYVANTVHAVCYTLVLWIANRYDCPALSVTGLSYLSIRLIGHIVWPQTFAFTCSLQRLAHPFTAVRRKIPPVYPPHYLCVTSLLRLPCDPRSVSPPRQVPSSLTILVRGHACESAVDLFRPVLVADTFPEHRTLCPSASAGSRRHLVPPLGRTSGPEGRRGQGRVTAGGPRRRGATSVTCHASRAGKIRRWITIGHHREFS